jgi:hypothetical protein
VVEQLGERWGLGATYRQLPLENESQHHVAFSREVRDVLCHHRAPFGARDSGDLRIVGGEEAGFADMDGVATVFLTEKHGSGWGEHLVDQEGCHASSASRC